MIKPELLDVVELLLLLPDLGAQPGELGTIVEVYGNPDNPKAYEVEFANDLGKQQPLRL